MPLFVMWWQTQSVRLLVPWETQTASALGCVDACPNARMNGVWIHTAATNSTMQIWRLHPETPRLTSPFSFTSAPPTCLAPTALRAVNTVRKDGLSVKPPDLSHGSDDVDERDVVYHEHVSAFLPTPSTVTSESSARLLFPLH